MKGIDKVGNIKRLIEDKVESINHIRDQANIKNGKTCNLASVGHDSASKNVDEGHFNEVMEDKL